MEFLFSTLAWRRRSTCRGRPLDSEVGADAFEGHDRVGERHVGVVGPPRAVCCFACGGLGLLKPTVLSSCRKPGGQGVGGASAHDESERPVDGFVAVAMRHRGLVPDDETPRRKW